MPSLHGGGSPIHCSSIGFALRTGAHIMPAMNATMTALNPDRNSTIGQPLPYAAEHIADLIPALAKCRRRFDNASRFVARQLGPTAIVFLRRRLAGQGLRSIVLDRVDLQIARWPAAIAPTMVFAVPVNMPLRPQFAGFLFAQT